MSKLKCAGRVIFTCKQLVQYAQPLELAAQMGEFASFAITHLTRNPDERSLTNLLTAAWKNQNLPQAVEQLEADPEECVPGYPMPAEYYEAMLHHCGSIAEGERVRTAAVMAAIGGLCRISIEEMKKLSPEKFRVGAEKKPGPSQRAQVVLADKQDVQIPAFSDVYHIPCNPALRPGQDAQIRTYCIRVSDVGSCQEAVLSFDSVSGGQLKKLVLPQGGRVYVNAINGVVVSLLPDQAGDMVRTAGGQLCLKGVTVQNSEGVTSFDWDAGSGTCLWASSGKPGGSYCSRHNTDMSLQYSGGIVEVALQDNCWYLLNKVGLVKTNDSRRRGTDGVSSLRALLGGKAI